jgi:hypothetical protein
MLTLTIHIHQRIRIPAHFRIVPTDDHPPRTKLLRLPDFIDELALAALDDRDPDVRPLGDVHAVFEAETGAAEVLDGLRVGVGVVGVDA